MALGKKQKMVKSQNPRVVTNSLYKVAAEMERV